MCSRSRVCVRKEGKGKATIRLWIVVVEFSEFPAAPFELPGPKCQAAGRLLLYLGRHQHEWANFCVVLFSFAAPPPPPARSLRRRVFYYFLSEATAAAAAQRKAIAVLPSARSRARTLPTFMEGEMKL